MTKHKTIKKHEFYKIEGGKAVRERKSCPKCGPGVFMANHVGRMHCGKCGYAEFVKA